VFRQEIREGKKRVYVLNHGELKWKALVREKQEKHNNQ
jgi:hypothetical protein